MQYNRFTRRILDMATELFESFPDHVPEPDRLQGVSVQQAEADDRLYEVVGECETCGRVFKVVTALRNNKRFIASCECPKKSRLPVFSNSKLGGPFFIRPDVAPLFGPAYAGRV